MPVVQCKYCGKQCDRTPTQIKRSPNSFCSRECLGKYKLGNIPPSKKVTAKCEQCGKELKIYESRVARVENNFCSHKCHDLFKTTREFTDDEVKDMLKLRATLTVKEIAKTYNVSFNRIAYVMRRYAEKNSNVNPTRI